MLSDAPGKRVGRCLITSAPAAGDRWTEQLTMIREAGAQFDEDSKQWFFFFEHGSPPIDRLNALFTIAARFGTTVVLDEITAP